METNPFENTSSTSENFVNRPAIARGIPVTPNVPFPNLSQGAPAKNTDPMDLFNNLLKSTSDSKISAIPISSFSNDPRYSRGTRPGDDWEEQYAQNQSWYDQAFRGTVKGLNLVGTTVAGGFGTIYGLGAALVNGDATKIFDNSVNQELQAWNEKVDRELLPNFYTKQEQDSEWWSTDNWMTTNFLFDKLIKNSGYAVGAMVGGNMANSLLGKIGTGIGVRTANLATKAEMSQAFKVFSPLLRNTSRAFSQGKNIEAFEILSSKLSSIADATQKSNQLAQLLNTSSKFAKFGDTGRRGLVALYSSAGEASMEAVIGGNQMKDKLIEDFINENGYEPTGQDLENINNTVKEFGKTSFLGNLALLGVTEYAQLPYLTGSSWRNTRNAIRNTTDDVVRTGSKLAEDIPTTRFGKLYKGVKNYGQYVFDPKEAGQEIGQFALEVGGSNYFEKANKTNAAENWVDAFLNITEIGTYGLFGRDEQGKGVGALVSKEGIESGILGGITGGLMQGPIKFAENKARKTNTQNLIEASAKAPLLRDVIEDRINTVNRGVILQEQQQSAALQNDILESKDLKTDIAFNYAMHKIKYGRTDLVLDEIEEMRREALSKENGFGDLQQEGMGNVNDTREEFVARLTELESFVNNLDEIYSQLNTVYGAETITNPATGELSRRFSDAAIERMAYATTKIKDYDRRIPELKLDLVSKGILIDEALTEVINDSTSEAIDRKLAEVDALDATLYTDADKTQLKQNILDVTDLTLRKKLFIDEFNDITKKPENYMQNTSSRFSEEVDDDTPKETIQIKTKKGARDIEVGTEYFLGKVVEYDEKGKEVYRAPRITILGKNEDGTIKVKDSDNKVYDLKPSVIEKYSLGKVSSTLSNKKAKFFMENWNNVFKFNFGKGVIKTGRLEYEEVEKGDDRIYFVYKNKKGELKRIEVTGNQFVADKKKGFTKPMIESVAELTAVQKEALVSYANTTDERTQKKLERRAEVINQLYEEVLEKQESTEKLISEKTDKLEKIRKEISEITEQIETNKNPEDKRFKEFKFKKEVSDAIARVNALSRMEQDLQKELEELESVKEELELNVQYINDLIDNIETLPESTKDFIAELNDELIDLEILVEETGKQINMVSSLLDSTRDAIKSAIKYLTNLIDSFKSRYPNVPSAFGQEWVDFLKANPNFLKLKPNYKAELEVVETIVAETEDFQITPNERRLEDLEEHLDILQGALKDYGDQIKVRENLLNKLEGIYNNYLLQKAQERELLRNQQLLQEFIGTLDNSIQPIASNTDDEKVYEADAKKSDYDVVGGTRPVTNDRPNNLRANRFGSRINSFNKAKRDSIKGVIVTQNTESSLIPGLTEFIVDGEANANDVIALVIVATNEDGTYTLVDEFGNALTEEQLQKPLDHAIFQVFPSAELSGTYSGKKQSMFRQSTDKDLVDSLTEQYKNWRQQQLAKTELDYPNDFTTSFGIPEYVTNLVEKVVGNRTIQVEEIDYNATTPVEKTGMVSSKQLSSNKLITVSTSDSVSEGSTTFETKPGRVFLSVPGGLIKLNNRQLNSKEATGVYEAILQLSKIAFDKGTVKDDVEAQQIIRWLKSVIYWGIAKTPEGNRKAAGYNNVWFETVVEDGQSSTKLFISGLGGSINFTPSEIGIRKNEIITLLSALYHNVNATQNGEDNWNVPYFEIVGFDKEGNALTKEWKNYQTYLLSSEGRKDEEIPLTTIVRPQQGENDVTRKGIYFTLNNTVDAFEFEITKPTPQPVTKEPTVAEQAKVAGAVDTPVPVAPEFVFDNKTPNVYPLNSGNVTVLLDENGVASFAIDSEENLDVETSNTIKAIVKAKNITEQEAQSLVLTAVEAKTKPIAFANAIPVDNSMVAAPIVEEQPIVSTEEVSNIDDEKADIEKRRQEKLKEEEYRITESSELFSDGEGTFYKVEKLKSGKNKVSIADENGKTLSILGEFDNSLNLDTIINGKEGSYGSAKNDRVSLTKQKDLEFTNRIVDKINAKYDAELAALEGEEEVNENIGKEITANAPFNKGTTTGKVVSITENKTKKGLYSIVLDNGEKVSGSFETNKFTWVKQSEGNTDENVNVDPFKNRKRNNAPDNTAFRLITTDQIRQFSPENFNKLEDWLKRTFPNIPVYRVKNMIKATNGRQAFGMFHKGAIYLYEGAETGTAYHEVFEAVWAMFTSPQERDTIAKDFRSRPGTYVDRFTGEIVTYNEATNDQMREELAEEFRDFVLYDKNPQQVNAPKTTSLLRKIFNEIVDFIKSFFIGKDAIKNTQDLFDRIGNGYYAQHIPFEQKLSFANVGYIDITEVMPDESSAFRFENINATEIHQIMQQMTYKTLIDLVGANDSLFEISSPQNKTKLYKDLREDVLDRIGFMADEIEKNKKITPEEAERSYNNIRSLYNNVYNQWGRIVKKHQEYLLSYGITFDENDQINYEDFEKSKDEGYGDARKIDGFRKLNSAVKILLATIPEVNIENGTEFIKPNTTGGVTLLPLGSVYVDLMNKLHDSVDVPDMINKLRKAAINNPNYRTLFTRIFKVKPTSNAPIDYNQLEAHDVRLIYAFWRTFKKQSPNVAAMFVLPGGEVVVGDSNTSGMTREYRRRFANAILDTTRSGNNPYITKTSKGYVATNKLVGLSEISGSDLGSFVKFLNNLGIEFTEKELKKLDSQMLSMFKKSVNGIIKSLKAKVDDKGLTVINTEALDIKGRLLELGLIKSKLESSESETTYFNINGERSQTFLGSNLMSNFYDIISKSSNLASLATTGFNYLLTDSFVKGSSVMLDRLYNEDGNKRDVPEDILKPYLIDGTINEEKGKNTESSKLNKRQRILQETNMNINGVYMNLVPGDANMQTGIKLHDKSNPFVSDDMLLNKSYIEIFKNYFMSELEMSREPNRFVAKGRNNSDLRFFKSILGDSLNKKITSKKNLGLSLEEVYNEYEKEINAKVEEFIDSKTEKSIDNFRKYNIIFPVENGYAVNGITGFEEEDNYSMSFIKNKMKQVQINFMIANIELHKLLYSDPYQYSDELKRIKNFTSPRQILSYGDSKLNSRLSDLYNYADEDELFNTNFDRDTINGATISDILSDNEELEYDAFEETDGGGYITDKGLRYLKIKTGEWTPENEEQYVYDMAYMKNIKGVKLNPYESLIFKKGNPNNQSNYTPIKPIAAGNKNMGRSYNDVLLDKFALFPISFRMMYELNKTSNMLKLYDKMVDDNVDYVVYQTGRKVGAEKVYQLYNKKGEFNTNPMITKEEKENPTLPQTVISVPLSIFGIQTEVPTKEDNQVTQGSQPTKLATMDYMQAGVPIDFMPEESNFDKRYNEWLTLQNKESYNNGDNLYKEIKDNQNLIEARIENGVEKLFKKLGITKSGKDSYKLSNPELTVQILKDELLKREVNENTIEALDGFANGDFVLEAIPSYQQIRNIIYSIANKSVVSTKIKGGQKVQVSSALLESVRAEAKEITDKKGNTKLVYQSNILDFYKDEDGKRVCEIMISRWFNSPLSDEELLKYLNDTPEGQKILSGVAFRIPTQKQNSIEVFKIKQFLPQGFGDSVIVPSALVKKVGSDFDIDKLFIYFKNVIKIKGELKAVPFYGIGEEAKNKFREMVNAGDFLSSKQIKELEEALELERNKETPEYKLMQAIFQDAAVFTDEEIIEDFINNQYDESVKDKLVDKLYRESLDNAYIESFEKLISHPLNFKNLVKPNSADQMKDLTNEIEDLLGNQKIDYSDVGEMLDREFMSELRNDLVTGKYNIGIAATSQTGNAQNQRSNVTIDESKLSLLSPTDQYWIGDAKIKFENFNTVNGQTSLSMIEDANPLPKDRNYISDVIGQFIDGYVDVNKDPWIMRLGVRTNVAGTWLFLIRAGVPLRDVAFFMNQPIIREYLQSLENNGYSYLFIEDFVTNLKLNYINNKNIEQVQIDKIPNSTDLSKMIGKSELEMNDVQNAQQLFILDEFLKYSKMASQLLTVTQATNFDTATFNDPFLIFKKTKQIEKARKTIISDVDNLLDASFIGKLKLSIESYRDGLAEILLTDRKDNPNGESMRSVLETVLEPYTDLNDRDFISISRKAVNTLFDWAVQTNTKLNNSITRVLLSNDKGDSTAKKVMELKKEAAKDINHKLHNNYVLKSLEIEKGNSELEPDNLYISAKDNKVYDQNQIIYGLREIKKFLPESEKQLYGDIVRLAVLQSGLTNSRISFTSLLPYEDFTAVYNPVLAQIDMMPNLSTFVDTNVFERTNWNDANIIPFKKETVFPTQKGLFKPETQAVAKDLQKAMFAGQVPMVINISTYSQEADSDIITFSWTDPKITKSQKDAMRKKSDYSYIKKGLFKKVYTTDKDGKPIPYVYESESRKGKIYLNYVYKMINAWGDSLYANEFYDKKYPLDPTSTVSRESVMDNGYEKAIEMKTINNIAGIEFQVNKSAEVEDDVIVNILDKKKVSSVAKESISLQSQQNKPDGLPSIDRTNETC